MQVEPQRHKKLSWIISPAKGMCIFWVNKWTDHGLFIVYNDSVTNYALRVKFSNLPKSINLEVTELGEMICVKKDWRIGFKFYTDKMVSLFDLKKFQYLEILTEEQAEIQNIIPSEQGTNIDELE